MAPNVDDYNSRLAKSMAKGTGNLIKGIFMVRDSTVTRLENGSVYVKGRVKSNSKPSTISPQTLRNLKRVQNMSIATEQVAKNVLEGVVKTVGFFSGAMMKSKPGKKFFKLLPGEVALVSMDAFGKFIFQFDLIESINSPFPFKDECSSTSLAKLCLQTANWRPTKCIGRQEFKLAHNHYIAFPITDNLTYFLSAAKVFDAVEKAGTDVMQSTKMYTQDVVSHRYGDDAGQVTETTLATAGHVFATAWTVSKVRRALNPSKFRPSKTGLLKAAAKAAVGGRSK
jgi:hypothetical protein